MKGWIIGLFTFSFMVVSLLYIQSYFVTEYGLVDDIELSSDYNVYNETVSIVGNSRTALLNQSVSEGSAADATIQGAWATLRNLPNVVPITFKLLSRASKDLGFPPFVVPIFVSMILTLIIVWIIHWIAGLVRRT